tara:strand:+ start:1809 stop:3146 length:1338 start_codon:yes stop_codon:yes gene_type:complete
MPNSNLTLFQKELNDISEIDVFSSESDRQKFSRDFYDYSPILSRELKSCIADFVIRPLSVDAVLAVARLCKKYSVFITVRGSGTGNYGQCVPLKGGVVMVMSQLKKIRNIDLESGLLTLEPGCILRDVDKALADHGRQLRLIPSTWRSASIAGFIAGGSGGIGSVRWGFLRDPGHLIGLEIITLEDNPRKIQLDACEAEGLNHAYGTNGIITALTISTTKLIHWQEVVIDCSDLEKAVKLMKMFSCAAVELFLCTLIQDKIAKKIPSGPAPFAGKHRILVLVSPDGVSTLRRITNSFGGEFVYCAPEKTSSGISLRELTWNHTTLHMRSHDPSWTYLQMLLPEPEVEIMKKLNQKWGDDLLWHLEAVRQNGSQRLAALPIVRWENEDSLQSLLRDCQNLGAINFNPHVITVEDGGLGIIDGDQVSAKKKYDPEGLLNPGKLRGWM